MIAMWRSTRDFFAARLKRALALRDALYDKPFYRLVPCRRRRPAGPGDRPLRRHADGADRHRRHGTADRRHRSQALDDSAEAQDHHPAQRRAVARAGRAGRLCEDRARAKATASRWRKMARAISPTWPKARRPAGITTSATTAPSSPAWPRARRVLDAYSYTGGFGILAAKAGAKEVVCLDSSRARAGAWPRKAPAPMA